MLLQVLATSNMHLTWTGMALVGLLLHLPDTAEATKNAIEDQLITSLLLTYNQHARPAAETVNVTLQFSIASLDGIDERDEVFQATVKLTATWHDKRLQWNPDDWSGIDSVSLPASKVWVPDLALVNSAKDIYNKAFYTPYYLVEVSNLGDMTWATYGPIAAKCKLSLWDFPFDTQMCYFHYESWIYRSYLSTLKPENFTLDMVTESGEWQATKASSLGVISEYSYSDAYFCLTLKRKTQFYLLRYIFPTASLSALVSLVFFLPNESGEKITLDITLLLAFFFLFVDVSSILPVTSDYTPLLSKYLVFVIVISGLSLVCTTIVIRISHSGDAEIPAWVQRLLVNKVGRWLRVVSHKVDSEARATSANHVAAAAVKHLQETLPPTADHAIIDDSKPLPHTDPVIQDILMIVKAIEQEHMDKSKNKELQESWVIVGMVFDRLFFLLYAVATILVSFVLLLIKPSLSGSNAPCSPCDCYNGFVY